MSTATGQTKPGVGTMLVEALAAKAHDRGSDYSYRDLEEDSGVHYSYVSKVKSGKTPSRAVIEAWSKALAPHFPYDEALVRAGYLPDDQRLRETVRQLVKAPARVRRKVELELGLLLFSEERPRRRKKAGGKPTKQIHNEEHQPGNSPPKPEPCFT